MVDPCTADAAGVFHPCSEGEVQALVRRAARDRRRVRVVGARHSAAPTIGAQDPSGDTLVLALDRMRSVHIHPPLPGEPTQRVTVQAGCNIGVDPRDPTGRSTLDNSLCTILDTHGLALANLGGIAHQTIAGMLMTGSCGGSATHDFHAQVVGIRIVDGLGELHDLEPADGDRFWAAGVSMGLLGVVVSVTLACEPRYDIEGDLSASGFDDAPFDMTGSGPHSLEAFLRDTPYARLEWWPQHGLDRVVVWQARRRGPADHDVHSGAPGALVRRRFLPFDEVGGTSVPVQAAGSGLMSLVGKLNEVERRWGAGSQKASSLRRIVALLYEGFVLSADADPVPFRDGWFPGLCMDDALDDRAMPLSFGEIWLPIEHTGEAVRRLRREYRSGGAAAWNLMACEIYAAGASPFLMSPGHGRASVRLNWYWHDGQAAEPARWMAEKYRLFEDLSPRLHWGKVLPTDPSWLQRHVRPTLTGWDRFEEERRARDPDGRFLTPWWAAQLGLGGAVPQEVRHLDTRIDRLPVGSSRPVVFRAGPLAPDADIHRIDRIVPFPVERARAAAADLTLLAHWWPGIQEVHLLSGGPVDDDSVLLLRWRGGRAARLSVARTEQGWELRATSSSSPRIEALRIAMSCVTESPGYTTVSVSAAQSGGWGAPRLALDPRGLHAALVAFEHRLHTQAPRHEPPHPESPPMSTLPERVAAFFAELSTRREGALDRIPELFSPDLYYRDPLREARGHEEFRELFIRMFAKYKWVELTDFRVRGTEERFSIEYKMKLKMVVGPTFSLPMVTLCEAEDGKVVRYVDYFDMVSALMSPSTRLQRAYQGSMVAAFL